MGILELYILIAFLVFACFCVIISTIRDKTGHNNENNYSKEANMNQYYSKEVKLNQSDGFHTFDELYYHRTALFACLISTCQDKTKTFKSHKHHTGDMYDGYFIAGIKTSEGWCTYHCQEKWWPLFDCPELEYAPEWDKSTPSDSIHRLMHEYLPKQEVNGESK